MRESDKEAIQRIHEQMVQLIAQLRTIADRNSRIRLDFAINKFLAGLGWMEEEHNGEDR